MFGRLRIAVVVVSLTIPAVGMANDDLQKCADGDVAVCDRIIYAKATTKSVRALAYTNRGQKYYEEKNYAAAEADFDLAVREDSSNANAYKNRGNVKFATGRTDAAIDDYTVAIKLDRTVTAAFTARGLLYERKGDNQRAIADYRSALAAVSNLRDGPWSHEVASERLKALGQ